MSREPVLLTVLSSMAGKDIDESFDRHVLWKLRLLDLKDSLLGKSVEQLTVAEAKEIAERARRRKLKVHTLSTCLFNGDVEQGERGFRDASFPLLKNVLEVAPVLNPRNIRLLIATSGKRAEILDSSVYLANRHPWVFDVYREAIDAIREAGFHPVIENEVGNCLWASPQEIIGFFSMLGAERSACLTWDVQNLWQMGTFPSPAVYRALKPFISMIHVKGGRSDVPGGRLKRQSFLEDASWPVVALVKEIIADGKSPVICLNPSHGELSDEYTHDYARDLEFLRREIEDIE